MMLRPLLVMLLLLQGCSWQQHESPPQPLLLSDRSAWQPAIMPAARADVPRRTLAEVAGLYEQALTVTDDPLLQRQIRQRLAGLSILQGEEALYSNTEVPAEAFQPAIEAFVAPAGRLPGQH